MQILDGYETLSLKGKALQAGLLTQTSIE